MRYLPAVIGIALFCSGSTASTGSQTGATVPATPVVVELFTSEGCSSCPPADALLQRLAAAGQDGVRVIALGEHVDYWDRLGWKDRFSSGELTARQRTYASRFNIDSIYTPQMVVDGRTEFVGSDASAARSAITKAAAARHGTVTLALEGGPERPAPQPAGVVRPSEMARPFTDVARPFVDVARPFTGVARPLTVARPFADVARPFQGRVTVTVTNLPPVSRGDHADILLGITEDHLQSDVKAGENRGRVLAHAPVVRKLTTIGEVVGESGSAATELTIAPDWRREHLTIVAFVQERRSRTVLAAVSLPLASRP